MQEFNIALGEKDLFTLKNQSFDVENLGSADLQVDEITVSSNNVVIPYIKVPFTIIQSSSYNMYGDLKILNAGDSTGNDYIDYEVSWVDETSVTQTDTLRYYLNYDGIMQESFTQILKVTNISYIKNMICLLFDTDITSAIPDILLRSIDDIDYNIFSRVYRISDDKFVFVFMDNTISNFVVDDNITFAIFSDSQNMEISKISYRTI